MRFHRQSRWQPGAPLGGATNQETHAPSPSVDMPPHGTGGVRGKVGRALLALAGSALLVVAAVGCDGEREPAVVSAEFMDEVPDGKASQGETIRVRLDRPLPEGLRAEQIEVHSEPAMTWSPQVEIGDDRSTLVVTIRTGAPPFHFGGVYPKDAEATGLALRLGGGMLQVVDLQRARVIPLLTRVIWEDSSPRGGDGVVDEGDTLRLVFDQPVRLSRDAREDGGRVVVPRDVLLANDGIDRLDDGTTPSVFRPGREPREIDIVLGSRPVLTVANGSATDSDRPGSPAPSALAVNGTELYPMPRIVAAAGGAGTASDREADIEFSEDYVERRGEPREAFPTPGPRASHTVTALIDNQALVAGGVTPAGLALSELLIYDPYPDGAQPRSFRRLDPGLPAPAYNHTATALPGPDGRLGTFDDLIVLTGGEDGEQALSTVSVVRFRVPDYEIEALEVDLRVPRTRHQSVALSANSLLIDGGLTYGPGRHEQLVGCAEILTFDLTGENGTPQVTTHEVVRTLPRVDHSLTLMAADNRGNQWVLAYGGYGENPYESFEEPGLRSPRLFTSPLGQQLTAFPIPEDAFLPLSEGRVLVAPVLINTSNTGRSLPRLYELEARFATSLLRRQHRAVGIGDVDESGLVAATEALIFGGTLRHPRAGFAGEPLLLWELPLAYRYGGGRLPERQQALNAVRFTLDVMDPAKSRLEVLPHPSPEPAKVPTRVKFSATAVPGLGVVIAGGEPSAGDARPLASLEVFLVERQRLAEFVSLRLTAPRSRHQAYLAQDPETGRNSLFLIGGLDAGVADVERVPLPGEGRNERE